MYFPTWESFLNTVDKTSTAWRQLIGQSTSTDSSGVATGTILDFGGTAAPTGYLSCDGSVVSQTTYAALFTAISTTWNTGGEGAGNFRLPNLNRRTTVGSGGSGTGTLGNAVGNTGGSETHALSIGELAAHDHGAVTGGEAAHTHTGGSLSTSSNGSHGHNLTHLREADGGGGAAGGLNAGTLNNSTSTTSIAAASGTYGTIDSQGAHTHSVNVGTSSAGSSHTHSVSSQGSGTAHNNMQPSAVVLKIIKT